MSKSMNHASVHFQNPANDTRSRYVSLLIRDIKTVSLFFPSCLQLMSKGVHESNTDPPPFPGNKRKEIFIFSITAIILNVAPH